MSFLHYIFVTVTCLLVIIGTEASLNDDSDEEGILFYSSGSSVNEYNLKQRKEDSWISHWSYRVVGLAVSAKPNVVYWSNIQPGEKKILSTSDHLFGTVEVIADTGLVAPEQLSVDWVTGNVYFIDKSKEHIGVCTENGAFCTIILKNPIIDTPGGLVLNPQKGELFWSDYGSKPAIWTAGMDGNEAKAIVTRDLGWPKSLAIDYSRKRLYWIDSKFESIESISLTGTDRQRLLKTEGKRLRSIVIFDKELYWSDWQSNTIESVNIVTGKNRKLLVTSSELIYDMDIYHSALKPALPNPCNNHDCSELCLLALNRHYTCACQFGKVLNTDLHTCGPVNELPHLVIAAGDKIIHYYEVLFGKTRMKVTLTPLRMSQIVYDRNTGNLITDDQFTNALYSLNPVNNEIRRITSINSKNLGGLDFNYKNNITSWSVISLRQIHQRGLHKGKTRRYVFNDIPMDILAIPEYEKTFVAFYKTNHGFYIDWLDPAGWNAPRNIIPKLTESKISFAYDERSKRLYFAGAYTGIIESVSLNSITKSTLIDRQVLCSDVGKPVSLAVSNGKLFWTNEDSNVLQWIELDDEYLEIKSINLPIETNFKHLKTISSETHSQVTLVSTRMS